MSDKRFAASVAVAADSKSAQTPARPTTTIEASLAEPWVILPNGAELATWGRDEEIAYNQISRQSEKVLFFRRTFDFLTDSRIQGDYFEFGCHRCRTFRMALTEARRHNLENMQFHAFDSFEGLPALMHDTSIELWKRGALSTSEETFLQHVREHGVYVDRVKTIKGFYADSLSPALRREYIESARKIALVNIDCDLYESAVPVFKFIDPLLQEGAVVYVDDLFAGHKGNPHKGVARAFLEWQKGSRWKVIRHLDIGWWGRSYIVYLDKHGVDGTL
ncbi:MAG: TylF/MycF/NovP-related O-methyltransferase [Xanthobacteraceae bacterium]